MAFATSGGSEMPSKCRLLYAVALVLNASAIIYFLRPKGCLEKFQIEPVDFVIGNSSVGGDKSATCARSDLVRSETIYQRNLDVRSKTMKHINCSGGLQQGISCGRPFYQMVYLIPTYQCSRELYVGNWGEGGKWICDCPAVPRRTSVIYSVGSNGDPSFEQDMLRIFQVKSFTFDPTLRQQTQHSIERNPAVNFYPFGLTGAADKLRELKFYRSKMFISPDAVFMHLDDIMKKLGHTFIDIFKVDCERCEEELIPYLETIATREKPLFGQLQIEFHDLQRKANASMHMIQIIERLGYRLFRVDPNFYEVTDCWELAYIHESLVNPERI